MHSLQESAHSYSPPQVPALAGGQELLQEAFRSFMAAAGTLERRYRELQREVVQLRSQLESANIKLEDTLCKNQEMDHYLHGIVEALPCGVVAIGGNGKLELCNPEATRLFASRGAKPAEFLHWLLDCSPREASDSTAPMLAEVSIRCSRLGPQAPRGAQTIAILRDTTEERRMEEEREIARRSKALAEISTILAHEIRNPLASLELFAGLVVRAPNISGEARNWGEHIQAGLRLLAATVNNVLQFHSDAPIHLSPMNVCESVRTIAALLGPIARQDGKQIALALPLLNAGVIGDPHRLQQVFMNLALNALHAMEPGQALKVGVRFAGDAAQPNVCIDFEDQGCGIPASDLARIFEPGFRRRRESSGLGLAVCQKIVQQHRGTIAARSAEGKGTTVTVTLPVTPEIR